MGTSHCGQKSPEKATSGNGAKPPASAASRLPWVTTDQRHQYGDPNVTEDVSGGADHAPGMARAACRRRPWRQAAYGSIGPSTRPNTFASQLYLRHDVNICDPLQFYLRPFANNYDGSQIEL